MRKDLWESLDQCAEIDALNESLLEKFDYTGKDVDKNAEVIEVNKKLQQIPANAFKGQRNVKQFILHDGLLEIGEGAFSGCTSLTALSIPISVRKIGRDAFKDTPLKKITLPAGIAKNLVDDSEEKVNRTAAKDQFRSIQELGIDPNRTYVAVTDASWINSRNPDSKEQIQTTSTVDTNGKDEKQKIYLTKAGLLYIEAGIKSLDRKTLYELGVKRQWFQDAIAIEIPATVEYIEKDMFSANDEQFAMPNLQTMTWFHAYNSAVTIGDNVFKGCRNLKNALLPHRMTKIPSGLLANCPNLEWVVLPIWFEGIGNGAFSGCPKAKFKVPKRLVIDKDKAGQAGEKNHKGGTPINVYAVKNALTSYIKYFKGYDAVNDDRFFYSFEKLNGQTKNPQAPQDQDIQNPERKAEKGTYMG